MTQNEAVYEALKELGGRSTNKLIYKHALPKADFSNAKTPKNTIRTILQRHPMIQKAVGKPAGWWELCSYNEEREQLKTEIAQRDATIAALMERFSVKNCVTLEQIEAKLMALPDWQTVDKRIDNLRLSGMFGETDLARVEANVMKAFKAMQTGAMKGVTINQDNSNCNIFTGNVNGAQFQQPLNPMQ